VLTCVRPIHRDRREECEAQPYPDGDLLLLCGNGFERG
jgi:hypothetical protein